jgi:hypothetical protein
MNPSSKPSFVGRTVWSPIIWSVGSPRMSNRGPDVKHLAFVEQEHSIAPFGFVEVSSGPQNADVGFFEQQELRLESLQVGETEQLRKGRSAAAYSQCRRCRPSSLERRGRARRLRRTA